MRNSVESQIKRQITELVKPTQFTTAVHQKNSILLKRLYENSDAEAFTSAFKKIIIPVLSTDSGNAFIERTMEFIALFCSLLKPIQTDASETSEVTEHPFVSEIISYLLSTSALVSDMVRFRSCELINKILNHLVGSEVSSTLCDQLEESLLIRLHDPKNVVRQQAVLALHRLQDPTNLRDVVIQEFIRLMNSDSFAKIRIVCIDKIALRADVITHIIERIRDVDVNVRITAFKKLSNFVPCLKISQRRHILQCGFFDSSDKVKDFLTTNLIPKWLSHYQDNILHFMMSVRLDADETDVEKTVILFDHILNIYFKTKPLTELTQVLTLDSTKLIPIEALNWETAFYWRTYVQFLNKNDEFEEELNQVIPELVNFSKYVTKYYSNAPTEETVQFLEKQFILKQLFLIIETYDFGDVANRECLNSLVSNILEQVDLMSDVTEIIIKCLENSIPDVDKRCQFVSEIISEIMFPLNADESEMKEKEKEFQLAKISVKLNCLVEDQETAVTEKNYMEAERLEKQIAETKAEYEELKNSKSAPQQVQKKTDVPTIIKYLDIAAGLLLSPQINKLNSTLLTLKDDVIQELLGHNNDNVKAKAMRCYALCCIVDKACASTGIHIFSTPIFAYKDEQECDTQILITCIGAAVDLIRIYGPQLIAAPDDNVLSESVEEAQEREFSGGTSLTDLIQGLVELMDDEQYEIQEKAAWGLCQLLLSDRIHSPSLISRLVLKWCSPASEHDGSEKLTQLIGFALGKVPLTASADRLDQAVIMTVKVLADAPRTSPLSSVNIDNIANFMMALCKMSPKAAQIQANLAIKICFEIKDNPKSKLNTTLSKMLLLLDKFNDKLVIKDLLKICDEIRDDVKERMVLNNVTKFVSTLDMKSIDGSSAKESVECTQEQVPEASNTIQSSGHSRTIFDPSNISSFS